MDEKFLKLTNTVYKLLEFFPESDPLKNRAKDRALAIMEHLVLINETKRLPADRQGWATFADVFSEEKVKAHLLEDIDILLGYLWIGKSQGWLSSVNCLIIANEYEKIKNEIAPIMVPLIELTQKLPGMNGSEIIRVENKEYPAPVLENTGAEKEGTPVSFDQDNMVKEADISDRQKQILDFLAKNDKAQVMDLQKVLPDITKRTIRRDLDELLESGKIVRMGDFNEIFYKIK